RHTRSDRDWSSDVCSSDLLVREPAVVDGGAFKPLVVQIDVTGEQAAKARDHRKRPPVGFRTPHDAQGWLGPPPACQGQRPRTIRSEERRVGKECEASRWEE